MKQKLLTTTCALILTVGTALADQLNLETEHTQWDSGFPVGPIDVAQGGEPDPQLDAREEMALTFIFHIDEDLTEQDVFYEKVPESGEVWRPTGATRDMDVPLYASADPVKHTPLQTENTGPWKKGEPLGITLGEWFSAKGSGTYVCENGEGEVDIVFNNLVPNGNYTMWHDFAVWPPTEPFLGFYDLPFGARDGSENTFVADANGYAVFQRKMTPCLQLSGEQLISELAIAYHSDGKTYGHVPGDFGSVSHVQLYAPLPKRTGL
ncbi:hypothetical protein [uncultured Roseobacter sp.]|uniref:hypothetical protein n=1 Tax=uncultured Roseobacter sp. TaxID=114847 RepID=UPI00262484AB|nr:hypothetical protein [uncultured Roseobacter sp.]